MINGSETREQHTFGMKIERYEMLKKGRYSKKYSRRPLQVQTRKINIKINIVKSILSQAKPLHSFVKKGKTV